MNAQDDGPDPLRPEHVIVVEQRIPRTALAIVAGAALGVAGALMQGLTPNPLADPGLLGVNDGASFAMTVAVVFLPITSLFGYIWFSFWAPCWPPLPSTPWVLDGTAQAR